MEVKKKRVMTKPLSELQKNTLRQGRVLYYFNGLITRMRNPDYDVRGLMSPVQIAALKSIAQLLHGMNNEVIESLQKQREGILVGEIRSGKRCPKCNAVGDKLTKTTFFHCTLYAACKRCSCIWEVTK